MGRANFKFRLGIADSMDTPENTSQQDRNQTADSSCAVKEAVQKLDKPKSLLDAYRIIPRNKIRANIKNNYPISEMEKLEYLILSFGLIEDIAVIYSMEEDIYIIESGHRRVTALDNLITRYQDWTSDPDNDADDANYQLYLKHIKPYESGYVCKVLDRLPEGIDYDPAGTPDSLPESLIDSEIRLIIGNEGARTTPPAVKAQNVRRLAYLLQQKNNARKHSEKLNINEEIASQLHITPRQVINYKNIGKLIPGLYNEFVDGNLSLKDGSYFAKLSSDEQNRILKDRLDGHPVTAAEYRSRKSIPTDINRSEKKEPSGKTLEELSTDLTSTFIHLHKLFSQYQKLYTSDIASTGYILSPADLKSYLNDLYQYTGEPVSPDIRRQNDTNL